MNNDIIIYAKYDENNSIIRIVSNIFLDDTDGYVEIDRWVKGEDRYLYTHADDGEYVKEKHGKPLYDEKGIPNFHGNFVEWSEEEKNEKYPTLYNPQLIAQQEAELKVMMERTQRVSFLVELSDEDAIKVKLLFDAWEDDPNKFSYEVGMRRTYNNGLWKCEKAHEKQESWYPGVDPTLWTQLDKDEHKGTQDDPIPVPDSVTTSEFEYVIGKYYLEGEDVYICKREDMSDGETIKLFYKPSQQTPHYFEKYK